MTIESPDKQIIGKVMVNKKGTQPMEELEEKLTSPSFALIEVQGTKQMIQKQAYNNEMGTSPISH